MKRSIFQGLGLRSLFHVNPVSLSFAKMRLVILSVSLISMVLIWPAGLSQARDMATVQHSNPTSLPSKSLKTIIVSDYYPYTFVNDKGVPDGFSVDVAKAVASSMDLNLDIRVDTWEHATRALSDGTIDLLPMMAYSPERDKAFDFSAPHTIAYDAVFSRSRSKRVGSLKDLTDKTVIVMNKDAAHQYLLTSGMAAKMKLILVDSLPDALRSLSEGRGDAALMPKLVGLIIMKNLKLSNLDPSPVVIDAYNRPFSFAVKEGNQTMLERLSQGLSIIKSTGQYKDIYNKWFGALEPPALSWKTVIKYIAIIVAVFSVIALGLTVWTIFLRRQVALQTKHLVEEIQERKRTEEALRKSEAKYSSYVENAPDGVFIADEKGRYIEVNKAACLMTGFTEEELLQMFIPDLLSEESLEAGLAHFKALTETGVSKGELQYKRKDGSKQWWFVDAVKLSETRFLGFTKDVTERKHAEIGLQQITERFNLAMYASKAGAWDWDIITGQVEWSSQMFDLFGLDPLRNKASFDTWERALHPQDAEIAAIRIDQALKQQAILNSDYRVLMPDGQIRWINAVGQGEYSEQGNPLRMTGICMDITERKQAEEKLKLHMTVMETVGEGIFLIGLEDSVIKWTNRKFDTLFGYEPGEMIGMHVDKVNAPTVKTPAETRISIVDILRETGEWHGEIQNIKKDGTYFWSYIHVSLFNHPEFGTVMVAAHTDITDRKRSEEELRLQSEIMANMAEAVYLIRMEDGIIVYTNTLFERMFGYEQGEMIGKHVSIVNAPSGKDPEEIAREIMAEIKEQGSWQGEVHNIRKDGTRFWCYASISIFDHSKYGKVLVTLQTDITHRKQAEVALRELNERYSLALDVGNAGVWEWYLESNEVRLDDCFHTILGYTPGELPTTLQEWLPYHYPEDMPVWMSKAEAYLRGDSPIYESEHRIRNKAGNWDWVFTRGKLVNHSTMGSQKHFLGIAINITERKKTEEDKRSLEERMHTLVNTIPDLVWLKDEDGVYLACNRVFELFFGAKEADIVGKTDYDFVDNELADFFREHDRKAMALGRPSSNEEWVTFASDGHRALLDTIKTPMYDAGGALIGVLGIGRDITDRIVAQEEKQNLEERLQRAEKMEALGTLAGGVAHDLNNVLGIVVGYAEMLMDEIGESSPLRDDVMKIMEGGNRSAAIVQDLLTLARRGVQTQKVVNLNATIKDYQKTPEFEALHSLHRHVHIKIDLETDLLNIMGSPVHLGKTIINLVANAMESITDSGTLTIATSNQSLDKPVHGYDTVNEGDYVVLSITDTGEGISESDIKHIFEPFYTKKVMGRSGTGLGLAVVWGTVKDHNGYINVQSEIGKGTTFTLYFPVTREDIAVVPTAIPLSDYIGNDESILVIDDIKEQRELAAKMLGKLNYKVKTVSSGEEAVEYLRAERADLLVLDMIMDPGMDGLDTYIAILELHPNQKAIIVSGFSETDRVKEAKILGAGDYLRKPYVMERLGLAVRKELDRK